MIGPIEVYSTGVQRTESATVRIDVCAAKPFPSGTTSRIRQGHRPDLRLSSSNGLLAGVGTGRRYHLRSAIVTAMLPSSLALVDVVGPG
jgi:hypothetical protein